MATPGPERPTTTSPPPTATPALGPSIARARLAPSAGRLPGFPNGLELALCFPGLPRRQSDQALIPCAHDGQRAVPRRP